MLSTHTTIIFTIPSPMSTRLLHKDLFLFKLIVAGDKFRFVCDTLNLTSPFLFGWCGSVFLFVLLLPVLFQLFHQVVQPLLLVPAFLGPTFVIFTAVALFVYLVLFDSVLGCLFVFFYVSPSSRAIPRPT